MNGLKAVNAGVFRGGGSALVAPAGLCRGGLDRLASYKRQKTAVKILNGLLFRFS